MKCFITKLTDFKMVVADVVESKHFPVEFSFQVHPVSHIIRMTIKQEVHINKML